MAETLRKLEQLFTITPQRMRKIVDGFIDVLENGLEKPGQMVVSWTFILVLRALVDRISGGQANDSDLGFRLSDWQRERGLSGY